MRSSVTSAFDDGADWQTEGYPELGSGGTITS